MAGSATTNREENDFAREDDNNEIVIDDGRSEDCKDVLELKEKGIFISERAARILNDSSMLEELGRSIFLDRYALKSKREDIKKGDLVICISRHDPKYPRKDLAIVKDFLPNRELKLYIITGEMKGQDYEQGLDIVDMPTESVNDAYARVARAVASVDKKDRRAQSYQQFYHHLGARHIQPAGRIMTAANVDETGKYTSNLTMYNCYVIPSPHDSRDSIIKDTLFQMTEIMSRGGGVGINLSTLRPRYAYVRGVHGKSSGAVSWGGLYSYGTALIEQGGSRRGALMLMLTDWHPDVAEFIEAKTKKGMLENANISVLVSDAFMKAVKEDGDWNLEFPDYEHAAMKDKYDNEWDGDIKAWKQKGYPTRVYKTVRARELWDKIMSSAWSSAEPGIVFIDRYNEMSNSWYFNRIICTNPCGEQGLPAWGVCNLGHLNLASFANEKGRDEIGPTYEFDWAELKSAAKTLARFLDNVIDLTPYHFPENEKNQKSERRVGGGTLGLGELLIKMRMRYGSEESLDFIDRIYKTIAEEMYKESSNLAKEKGAFPKFNAEKFLESGFMKQMPEEVRQMIRKQGIRNVTLTTQAPTGTVGTMLGTSTGIEPYFAFEFYRQSRLGFYKVLIPLAEDYAKGEDNKLPEFFVSAMELKPEEHVKVQAAVQKWTDSSISKTANAPADFTVEQTKTLYEKAYDWGCKGVTIYRDSSRDEQILGTDANMEKKNLGLTVEEETEETDNSNEKAEAKAITEAVSKIKSDNSAKEQQREYAPLKREAGSNAVSSSYYEMDTGYGTLHVNIVYDNMGPVKLFANISPIGTEISGLTSALSIMMSKYLQQGGDPAKLLKHLNSIKGDKPYGFGQKRVDSIPHAFSKILRDHLLRTTKLQDYSQQKTLTLKTESSDETKVADAAQSKLELPKEESEEKNDGLKKEAISVEVKNPVEAHKEASLFCPNCYSRNVAMMSGCSEPTCFDCGFSKCG